MAFLIPTSDRKGAGCRQSGATLMLLLALVMADGAGAALFSAAVSPEAPDPTDNVTLESTIRWATAGFDRTGVTVSWLSANDVVIDVDVSSPGPDEVVATVITSSTVQTVLGLLPAGDYTFSIREIHTQRSTGFVSSGGNLSGAFTVVPEPGTALLMGLGFAGLTSRRR